MAIARFSLKDSLEGKVVTVAISILTRQNSLWRIGASLQHRLNEGVASLVEVLGDVEG
jgi:hypothetical protein